MVTILSDFRNLLSGNAYNKLMPEPTEQILMLGSGNTDLSILLMKKMVEQTFSETEKLSQALQQNTLKNTVEKVKWFTYNHIQYLRDDEYQDLRGPAYLWKHRYVGADCKSYSILASSILSNLGIKHSLRKIKQASSPTEFSHVYVVVPTDQKSGNVKNGVLVIDGTILSNTEPEYTEKYDLDMSDSMKHRGLYGVNNRRTNNDCNTCSQEKKIEITNDTPVVTHVKQQRGKSFFIVENFSVREIEVTPENMELLNSKGGVMTTNALNGLQGVQGLGGYFDGIDVEGDANKDYQSSVDDRDGSSTDWVSTISDITGAGNNIFNFISTGYDEYAKIRTEEFKHKQFVDEYNNRLTGADLVTQISVLSGYDELNQNSTPEDFITVVNAIIYETEQKIKQFPSAMTELSAFKVDSVKAMQEVAKKNNVHIIREGNKYILKYTNDKGDLQTSTSKLSKSKIVMYSAGGLAVVGGISLAIYMLLKKE